MTSINYLTKSKKLLFLLRNFYVTVVLTPFKLRERSLKQLLLAASQSSYPESASAFYFQLLLKNPFFYAKYLADEITTIKGVLWENWRILCMNQLVSRTNLQTLQPLAGYKETRRGYSYHVLTGGFRSV